MEEEFMTWQGLYDLGETSEDFETWYSGKCGDAYDRMKAERQDRGVP